MSKTKIKKRVVKVGAIHKNAVKMFEMLVTLQDQDIVSGHWGVEYHEVFQSIYHHKLAKITKGYKFLGHNFKEQV